MLKQNKSKYKFVFNHADRIEKYIVSSNSIQNLDFIDKNINIVQNQDNVKLNKYRSQPNLIQKVTNDLQTSITSIEEENSNYFLENKYIKESQQYKIFRQNQYCFKLQISQTEKTEKKGYQYYFKKNDTSIQIPSLQKRKQQSKTMNYIKYENFQKMKQSVTFINSASNNHKNERTSEPVSLSKRSSLYSSGYAPSNIPNKQHIVHDSNQSQKPRHSIADTFIHQLQQNKQKHSQNKIRQFEVQDKNRTNRFQQNQNRQISQDSLKKQQLTKKFQHIDIRQKSKHYSTMIDDKMGNLSISWNDKEQKNNGLENFKQNKSTLHYRSQASINQKLTPNQTVTIAQNQIQSHFKEHKQLETSFYKSSFSGHVSQKLQNQKQKQNSNNQQIQKLQNQIKQLQHKRQSHLDQILRQQKYIKQLQQANNRNKSIIDQKAQQITKTTTKYQSLCKAFNDLQQKYKLLQRSYLNKVQTQSSKIKQQYEQRLNSSSQKIQKYLSQIYKLNKRIEQIEENHREGNREIVLNYEKKIGELKVSQIEETGKLKEQHRQELINVNKYYQEKEKKLLEHEKQEVLKIKEHTQSEIEKLKEQHKIKIELLTLASSKQLQNFQLLSTAKLQSSQKTIQKLSQQIKSLQLQNQTLSHLETQLLKQKNTRYSTQKELNGYKLYVQELKKDNKKLDLKVKERQSKIQEVQKQILAIKSDKVKNDKQIEEMEAVLNIIKRELLDNQHKLKLTNDEIERFKSKEKGYVIKEIQLSERVKFYECLVKGFKEYDEVGYQEIESKVKEIFKLQDQNGQSGLENAIKMNTNKNEFQQIVKQQSSISPSTTTNIKMKKKMSLIDKNLLLERDLHAKKIQCEANNAKIKELQNKYNQLTNSKNQEMIEIVEMWQNKYEKEKNRFRVHENSHVQELKKSIEQGKENTQSLNQTIDEFKSKLQEKQKQIKQKSKLIQIQLQNIIKLQQSAIQISQKQTQQKQALKNKIQVLETVIQGQNQQQLQLKQQIQELLQQNNKLIQQLKQQKDQKIQQLNQGDKKSTILVDNKQRLFEQSQIKGSDQSIPQQPQLQVIKQKIAQPNHDNKSHITKLQQYNTPIAIPDALQFHLQQQPQPLNYPQPSDSPFLSIQMQYLSKVQQFYNQVLQVFGLEQINCSIINNFKSKSTKKKTKKTQKKDTEENIVSDNEHNDLTAFQQEQRNGEEEDSQANQYTGSNEKNQLQGQISHGQQQSQSQQNQHISQQLQQLYHYISTTQQQLLHIVNQWIRKLQRQAYSINQYKQKCLYLQQSNKQNQQQINILSGQKIQICEKYQMLVSKLEQENGELEEKFDQVSQKQCDMELYVKEVEELLMEANKKCMTYGLFGLQICKRERLTDLGKLYQCDWEQCDWQQHGQENVQNQEVQQIQQKILNQSQQQSSAQPTSQKTQICQHQIPPQLQTLQKQIQTLNQQFKSSQLSIVQPKQSTEPHIPAETDQRQTSKQIQTLQTSQKQQQTLQNQNTQNEVQIPQPQQI